MHFEITYFLIACSCLASFESYEKALASVEGLSSMVGVANGLVVAKESLEMKYQKAWLSSVMPNKFVE